MPFSQENGYVPVSIESIMSSLMANVNTQFGTTYTTETFVGTNFYKYFYALAQRMQESEIATSEIFTKLQQYFDVTNEAISRPVVTPGGLIDKLALEGYVASVKPIIEADAGKVSVCVDTDETADDYEDVKLAICELLAESVVAGAVTQGTESEAIVLSNGQSFDFKFNLPNRIPTLLRLTITLSENNQVVVGDPDDTKALLLANINASYKLGKNFEPQRYFGIQDAPWAESVLLEWSEDDGSPSYVSTVYDAEYDDLFEISLENITLVEA
jgi:hypothetical protein